MPKGKKRVPEITANEINYAIHRTMFPDGLKRDALVAAGYSPNTSSSRIENSKGVQRAMMTLEKQRELIQQREGFTFEDMAQRLKTRAIDSNVSAGVQTDNDKLLSKILGYEAPTVVKTQSLGLMLEFSDLSGADLAAMRDVLLPAEEGE